MNQRNAAPNPSGASHGARKYDPEATRANIIAVATREFAKNGLSGARIDEIAAKTKTSKRMIYYYFQDKEGLYRHVLEAAYSKVRAGEEALRLDHLPPAEALRALVEFTFDHHRSNPDFVRMVMIENIHHGRYLRNSEIIETLNAGVIEHIGRIYQAGAGAGIFRKGLEPLEIHWLISSLAFFNVSNKWTFSRIFRWERSDAAGQEALKREVVAMVMRFVLTTSEIEKRGY